MNVLNLIKDWLQRPFVFEEGKGFQLFLCSIIGFIVFIIIYTLRPFGINDMESGVLSYTAGYGLVTFLVLFFYFFVLTPLFPRFFCNDTWNVAKELGTIICCIVIIGFFCWYYNSLLNREGLDPERFTLKAYMGYAFTIGIFAVIIYVFISEWYLRFNRNEVSKIIMSKRKKENKNLLLKKKIKRLQYILKIKKKIFYLISMIWFTLLQREIMYLSS